MNGQLLQIQRNKRNGERMLKLKKQKIHGLMRSLGSSLLQMNGVLKISGLSNLNSKGQIKIFPSLLSSQINGTILSSQQKTILGQMLQALLSHQSTSGVHQKIKSLRIYQYRSRQKIGEVLSKQHKTILGLQRKSFSHPELIRIHGVPQCRKHQLHQEITIGTTIKMIAITEMISTLETEEEIEVEAAPVEEAGAVVDSKIASNEIMRTES